MASPKGEKLMKKLLSTFLALIITLSLFGGFNFFNESSVLNAEAASGLYVKGSNLLTPMVTDSF